MVIGIQIGSVSGCAVYDDGKIIYAASEERFSRKKNDSGYPINAIKMAIEKCEIVSEAIEKIVIPSNNMTPVHFLCNIGSYNISDFVKEEKEYYGPVLLEGKQVNYLEVFDDKCKETDYEDLYEKIKNTPKERWNQIWNEWRIKKVCEDFQVPEAKICIVNHEFSHAAYGIYGSDYEDYEDVLGIVYDGYGDESNASIYIIENGTLKQLHRYNNYNIGRLYRYITLLLGMKPNEHEYKVMGLGPYASPYIYKEPLEVFRRAYQFIDGEMIVNPELKDNYYYFKERLEGMRFDGIAGALQIFTEEMNCALVQYWTEKTGKKKCVISGGVALNIKANMEIGKLNSIDDLYVVGSAGDESLCIGSIFYYLSSIGRGKEIQPLNTLYLGDEIDNGEVGRIIKNVDQTKYELIQHPDVKYIAKKLADGLILGRVSGKMEFGARALGNRSIIADPRKRETVEKINQKIKSRDFWMPFTPSILKEDADKYLVNKKGFRYPFMAIACETTEIAKRDLKAAIHPADLTARPQLVTAEMNKGYYDLIKAFKDITGVGALLNTSLNIHGYPIARNVADAFKVLENSQLDGLVLDEYLVIRK